MKESEQKEKHSKQFAKENIQRGKVRVAFLFLYSPAIRRGR